MYQVTQSGNPTMLGSSSTTFTSTMPTPQPRRLEQTMKRLDHLVELAATIASTAEQVAIEYAGHDAPTAADKPQGPMPSPTSLIGNLESVAEMLELRLERIRAAVVRLQTL